jgi:hypothetical protein
MTEQLMPETLDALTRTLALTVGPIAKILVRHVADESTDVNEMLSGLVRSCKLESDARLFQQEARRLLSADIRLATVIAGTSVQPIEVKAVVEALLPLIGPIAHRLVERHLRETANRDDFYGRLSASLYHEPHKTRLREVGAQFERRGKD